MTLIETFALLLVAHALADYPLQGDFLSKAKNLAMPIPGVPWYQAMGAHAVIHAGFVGLITGSIILAVLEFACHWDIDVAKCRGKITYDQDQALHVACKVVWVILLWMGVKA